MKRARNSKITVFIGLLIGSLFAFFSLTTIVSASTLSLQSGFSPALGDHVLELARMLAAPEQSSSVVGLSARQVMLVIVGAGFITMLAGSVAFWGTLQRDFAGTQNPR